MSLQPRPGGKQAVLGREEGGSGGGGGVRTLRAKETGGGGKGWGAGAQGWGYPGPRAAGAQSQPLQMLGRLQPEGREGCVQELRRTGPGAP